MHLARQPPLCSDSTQPLLHLVHNVLSILALLARFDVLQLAHLLAGKDCQGEQVTQQ